MGCIFMLTHTMISHSSTDCSSDIGYGGGGEGRGEGLGKQIRLAINLRDTRDKLTQT